jgi:hypothetical protein
MADLETNLRTLTLLNASVAAAFGNRFHWNHIPDDRTFPCIKAQTITDMSQDTHSSTWGTVALVQLDVYDDDKNGCNTNAELVRGWLHRYKGAFGAGEATIKVRNMPSLFDAEERLYRRMLEVTILYTS